MKKRIMSILCVGFAALSLSACSGAKVEPSNVPNPTSNVAPTTSNVTSSSTTSNVEPSKSTTTVTSTTIKYNVKFNSNGGTSVTSQKVDQGGVVTKPNNPTRTGYEFLDWYINDTLETKYDFDAVVNSDLTLYAKWAINTYKVSFDSKGGTEVDEQTVEYKATVTKPEDPTKEGYTFAGWYTSSYYSTEYDFTKNVTKDLTLYAKWTEIPKTVSYEVGTPSIYIWTNSISARWMKVSIPVTNTGTADLYLDSASIDIESKSGQLLQTKSLIDGYPEYIKPGETGYFYVETQAKFTDDDVNVIPHVEVEKATNDVIRYDISDVSIQEYLLSGASYGIEVIGRVENKTSKKGTLVKIAAHLFDAEGNLICVCYNYLDNDLKANDKVGFTLSSYSFRDITPGDVASYEIYAYPTQFNF